MPNKQEGQLLAVVNQKGGVGKTTTAVNLCAYMAQSGKRVLLVDCDAQSNATSGVGIDKTALTSGLYDVLVENAPIADILQRDVAGIKGFDLAPSTLDLSGAEMALYAGHNASRESILSRCLESIRDQYDYILIDAPPSLGLITINVLTAAQSLVIPIQCEYYALEGISQLLSVIDRIRERLNPSLEIAMVVLTMQDYRTNLSQQVVSDVRDFFGEKVAANPIPRNVRLSEAPGFGKPISLYDPRSKGASSYKRLATELMERT